MQPCCICNFSLYRLTTNGERLRSVLAAGPIARGEIWWAELPEPRGSEPGYTRPVLVVQAEMFNQSRLRTVLVAGITTNLAIAEAPGNVLIPASASGLPKTSVVNISQLFALDRLFLREHAGVVPGRLMAAVDEGLRLILAL